MQNYINIVIAVFQIWAKNIKNAPKRGVFPHLWPPKIFFQKSGSVTFVPLWCTNFMQKIRKILRAVSAVIMLYDTKNDEKTTKSQKRGLVTTVQPKPEFSRTCGFREVLGIDEDCWTQNFIKIVRAVLEILAKNIKNTPKMGVFPHLWPPRFFSKIRLCHFSTLLVP